MVFLVVVVDGLAGWLASKAVVILFTFFFFSFPLFRFNWRRQEFGEHVYTTPFFTFHSFSFVHACFCRGRLFSSAHGGSMRVGFCPQLFLFYSILFYFISICATLLFLLVFSPVSFVARILGLGFRDSVAGALSRPICVVGM